MENVDYLVREPMDSTSLYVSECLTKHAELLISYSMQRDSEVDRGYGPFFLLI